jgi:hypothetical protein
VHIRCPQCGRRGYLPDRLAREANNLRCRRCKARFATPELARRAAERAVGADIGLAMDRGPVEPSGSFLADGFFSGYDDRPAGRELGPGDSNYELTFTLRDEGSDPDVAWRPGTDEFVTEAPSSDEIPSLKVPVEAEPGPRPWHHRFIASWALPLIGVTLGTVAISLPVVGYLLWRVADGGASAGLWPPALLTGLACAIALLMISVPLMLLAACLAELADDLRRLRDDPERTRGIRRG